MSDGCVTVLKQLPYCFYLRHPSNDALPSLNSNFEFSMLSTTKLSKYDTVKLNN